MESGTGIILYNVFKAYRRRNRIWGALKIGAPQASEQTTSHEAETTV